MDGIVASCYALVTPRDAFCHARASFLFHSRTLSTFTAVGGSASSLSLAMSNPQAEFDIWEFVSCAKCHLPFSADPAAPPLVPFWLTSCGHVLCNNHLSLSSSCLAQRIGCLLWLDVVRLKPKLRTMRRPTRSDGSTSERGIRRFFIKLSARL